MLLTNKKSPDLTTVLLNDGEPKTKTIKYGEFDDKNKEYVIKRPDTPYPWINYLGSSNYFSIISNTAGGYSFYRDARLRRITRYRYNNVPVDDGGKYFYINDNDTIWSPGWKPVRTPLDGYECRHGMGYTKITGVKNQLQAEVLFFVPINENVEIQKLTLTNFSEKKKSFKLFSFVEWCLWDANDDMTNFQRNFSTGEIEVHNSTIIHKTEYRERRNHFAYYHCNSEINGYDTDRESFLGLYNGFDSPQNVVNGQPTNSFAHGWSPIASHYIEIELNPNETKDYIFLLGYQENPDNEKFTTECTVNLSRIKQTIEKYKDTHTVETSFNQLKAYWKDLLGNYQVKSSDSKLNRMVNTWNQYQNMITYFFSRSASYFESGIGRGMGFRDSNQDLIGVVHMIPELARERILDIAATQLEDGSAYHQYQPLTKRGNHDIGGNFNDDPMWLVFSVSAYLKETGDWSILDEQVPYDNDENNKGTLFEHLTKSFYHVVKNLGPHNLPLIGRADWNDCLNLNCFSTTPGESFQTTENRSNGKAESLMIAGQFVLYGNEYVELCKTIGKTKEATEAENHITSMKEAVN